MGVSKSGSEGSKEDTTKPDTMIEDAGLSPWREAAFVFLVCLAQCLSLAGLAQTIAPLDIIGSSFGVTDEARLSWYSAAFSLTFGAFILPAGRLGDMYGHKTLYIIGFSFYAISSIIAGVAVYSGDVLLSVARALQGISCALFVPNALALVGRRYGDSPKKNMVFAMFGAAAPVGWTFGAVFASIFAQLAWWPWAFFAMALTCAVVIVAALVVIPRDELHPSKISDFDFLGTFTGVAGLLLFNIAWNQAAVVGWSNPLTYALLIVGILLLVAFAIIEVSYSKNP
ncbi:hypothetical protein AMS68_004680 [Peltaster fructicola]|uniref:Major facilitator superfamily (MFS) profile domain-containing protein n=1 Tax=Peltaster fructicola TaxID=286661 RepID=A0A6H0XWN8_9PEZI|nr:hypothetical protein AMS68_004680 [Peltaster fructicola]